LQHDLHIPVLTVGETLAFAHAATSGGHPDFSTLEELHLPPGKSYAASLGNLAGGVGDTIAEDQGPLHKGEHVMDEDGFVRDPSEQSVSLEWVLLSHMNGVSRLRSDSLCCAALLPPSSTTFQLPGLSCR
jgi:hypothetical protein